MVLMRFRKTAYLQPLKSIAFFSDSVRSICAEDVDSLHSICEEDVEEQRVVTQGGPTRRRSCTQVCVQRGGFRKAR